MKIAFDVAQTCAERAGCPWYADSLARALSQTDGVELDLLHHFGSWCNVTTERGTRIPGVAAPLFNLDESVARAFWRQAESDGLPGQPDIVHSNCFDAPALPGSRLVFTIYDLSFWLHPEYAQSATHVVCQRGVLDAMDRAAGLVFISQAGRTDFENLFPGWLSETGRPATILHGASRFSTDHRSRPPGPEAPWLCVGSIEPRKNHSALISAYLEYRTRVERPRPLILVGGEGWSSDDIHRRLRENQDRGVRYLGYVPDHALPVLYRAAYALVQPSWHEGFGLPVVEAMGFGVPVICSEIPALEEVASGAAAFFPPDDPAALAEIMVRRHADLEWAAEASARASRRSGDFSWSMTARRAIDFYRQILEKAP